MAKGKPRQYGSKGSSSFGAKSGRRQNDYDSDDMPARRVATPQKTMRKPMRPLKDK